MRYYESFDKLKEKVSETYSSIAMLLEKFGWDFFSEDGANKVEAYAILDDAFQIADSLEDLAKIIAGEVYKLEKGIQACRESRLPSAPKDAEEKNEVLKLLVKYIRHNLDEDLWKDYTEFDHAHTRGC